MRSEYAIDRINHAKQAGIPVYPTNADTFLSISDKDHPQGILAVVHQPQDSLENMNPTNFQWGVAIINAQDPGNVGTILRTIDSVGADGLILLDGGADPYHPTSVRASMGSIFWYPIVKTSFQEFSIWIKDYQYHVYGSSANRGADYRTANLQKTPRILLMGSEREGITKEQEIICDEMVSIPMFGKVSSLNISIATAVMLYKMLV